MSVICELASGKRKVWLQTVCNAECIQDQPGQLSEALSQKFIKRKEKEGLRTDAAQGKELSWLAYAKACLSSAVPKK